jgi:hypothetical protein
MENPYESPQAINEAGQAAQPLRVDVAAVRARLRIPAAVLLILACLAIMLHVVVLAALGFDVPRMSRDPTAGPLVVVLAVGPHLFFLFLYVVMLVGAGNMLRLRRYSLASLAAVISVFLCASPLWLLTLPIGIWALVALHWPETKAAFQQSEASRMRT